MRILPFLIFAILSGLFLSCETDNGPLSSGQFKIADYDAGLVPLAVGNRWTYIDSSFHSGSVSVSHSLVGIIGDTNIQYQSQSYKVYLENWMDYTTQKHNDLSWLKANCPEGLYCFGGIGPKGGFVAAKSLYAKYPARTGEIWNKMNIVFTFADSAFMVWDTTLAVVESTVEMFETPAGRFRCYVYTSHWVGFTFREYYAVNIGLVAEIDEYSGVIVTKRYLQSYQLK